MWKGPIHCEWYQPWAGVLEIYLYIYMKINKAEQAMRNMPVSSILCGLSISSCLQVPALSEFLFWLHLMINNNVECKPLVDFLVDCCILMANPTVLFLSPLLSCTVTFSRLFLCIPALLEAATSEASWIRRLSVLAIAGVSTFWGPFRCVWTQVCTYI